MAVDVDLQNKLPDDWGTGYYKRDVILDTLLPRLLMYGYTDDRIQADIPRGKVYGFKTTEGPVKDSIDCGGIIRFEKRRFRHDDYK